MVFKPKTPSMLPKSAMAKPAGMPGQDSSDSRGSVVTMPPPHQKESNILIKQASAVDGKAAKKKAAAAQANKGPTREEVFAKVKSILDILFSRAASEGQLDKIEGK